MIDTSKQRRSVRRFVLLLIAGGTLLVLDAWAQESGAVSNLVEDVLQLVVWSVLLLPLVVSLAPHIESRATRRTIYATYFFAIVWRALDVTNEIFLFDAIPVLGNDSKYHEIGKEVMALVVRMSILLVLVLLFLEMTRNITRLRRQTSRLQKLFENIPAVCFTFDQSGRILSWNRAAQRVYGYTAEEALGATPLSIIVTPESLGPTKQLIADIFSGKSVLDTEWRDRNKDGELGYRLGSAFPLFRNDGSVECGVNINVDITDRRKAEAALRASEERFRRAFDEGPLGMAFIEPGHRIGRVNQALCKMLGYTRDELVGKTIHHIAHPDDLERTLEMSRKLAKSQTSAQAFEKRYITKDGRIVWGRLSATTIRDENGKPLHGLGMVEDITDRKHAEDELKASEARFRGFCESNIVGVVFADTDGNVTDSNDAFLRMIHCDRRELPIRWTDLARQCDRHLDQEAIASLKRVGVAVPYQQQFVRRDGGLVPVIIGLTLVPETVNECIGFVLDLTEQKRAEAAAENERALLRKLLDLQERDRQTVSYDIHDGMVQYVVGAQMQVDACESTLDPKDGATAKKLRLASKHLRDAVHEGRRLISDLRPPIIDESGLVAAIDHLIGEVSRDNSLRIAFEHNDVGRNLQPFLESALYRIVQEALTNVRCHSGATEALVRLNRTDSTIRLEIRDWGRGFQRIAVPPDRFGLQGIEERARLLGGSAQVESQVGSGTRICVEIPQFDDDHGPTVGPLKTTARRRNSS